jgi:hypothetical protein
LASGIMVKVKAPGRREIFVGFRSYSIRKINPNSFNKSLRANVLRDLPAVSEKLSSKGQILTMKCLQNIHI